MPVSASATTSTANTLVCIARSTPHRMGGGGASSREYAFPSRDNGGRIVSEANPKGYNFQVRVTSGHEVEAKAAEMAKKPNRLGMLIVKLLGGKGKQNPH